MKQVFTKEETDYIIDNYQTTTAKELASKLGVNKEYLMRFLRENGIYKRTPLLNHDAAEFVKSNYLDMTYRDIGKVVGLSEKQVEGWIRNHIHNRKKKIREFNENYFSTIDTAEKAYWIGFIFADGYVVFNQEHRNYEFGIELQSGDEYILSMLNDCLGGCHKIHRSHKELLIPGNKYITKSDISGLRIYSKRIVLDLINNGISTNKSTKNIVPLVPDEFFRDFLRGYIDGDGCIHITHRERKSPMIAVHITCASRPVLEYINSKVEDLFGITASIYDEYDRKHRIYWYRKSDVKLLLDIIYYDNSIIKLKRKYDIYKSFYCPAA